MQNILGGRLYNWAFPATFFIPFLVEPVVFIFFYRHISCLLVRTYNEVVSRDAERALAFVLPFDLTRYSDLVLNNMLAATMLFFPGGFTVNIFVGLVASHVYIFIYDTWRALRHSASFTYENRTVDRAAMMMTGMVCDILMAGLFFKAHQNWFP